MSCNAMVRFGSDGKSLVIPFDLKDQVKHLVEKIASEKGVDAEHLKVVILGKQYNHTHTQTLTSIGAFDRMDVTVTTRMKGGELQRTS